MKHYSMELANAVKDFLKSDDWHYSFDEDRGVFTFGASIRGVIQRIRYEVRIKEDAILVYSTMAMGADPKDERMLARMALKLAEINYGLRNGNYELDARDGEIRFKSFIDCEGQVPCRDVIRNSLYITASMTEEYGPQILAEIAAGLFAARYESRREELEKLLAEIARRDGEKEMVLMVRKAQRRVFEQLAEEAEDMEDREDAQDIDDTEAPAPHTDGENDIVSGMPLEDLFADDSDADGEDGGDGDDDTWDVEDCFTYEDSDFSGPGLPLAQLIGLEPDAGAGAAAPQEDDEEANARARRFRSNLQGDSAQ